MYQFSYVLASVRNRVIPSLKDHKTTLETASRARICSRSLGHMGVFKSNALSIVEFGPLESNRQRLGTSPKMFCCVSHLTHFLS